MPRELAEEAETAAARGDIVTAMMRLREAFEQMFDSHQSVGHLLRSTFALGPKLTYPSPAADDLDLDDDFQSIIDAVQPLQTAVRLAVLSIEYTAYLRFDLLTPQNDKPYDQVLYHWAAPSGYAPTQEDFDFCMQFVVTASLRLAAAEAQASDPSWLTRDAQGRILREVVRIERKQEHRNAFIAEGRDPRRGCLNPLSELISSPSHTEALEVAAQSIPRGGMLPAGRPGDRWDDAGWNVLCFRRRGSKQGFFKFLKGVVGGGRRGSGGFGTRSWPAWFRQRPSPSPARAASRAKKARAEPGFEGSLRLCDAV